MDAERFDRITKALRAGTSRRRVLGGLVVGGLAGLLGWHEADAAECAKAGQKPKDDKPCCFGTAVDGLCPAETPAPTGTCTFTLLCQCTHRVTGEICAPLGTCATDILGLCSAIGSPCECVPPL